MSNPYWMHGLITVIALLCLVSVWHEHSKERLSKRATLLVLCLGPFSWAGQMWLLNHIDLTDTQRFTVLFWCTFAGLLCFFGLIDLNQLSFFRSRDMAQALVWGQLVFMLVLVTFLPQGIMSLVALLNF